MKKIKTDNLPNLNNEDAIVVGHLTDHSGKILLEKNSELVREAASLTKVLHGAEIARKFHTGEISDDVIHITSNMLAGYGTDVLSDLYENRSELYLSVSALVNLMLKYSCNSSTIVLDNLYLRDRKELETSAIDFWGMENPKLKYTSSNSDPENNLCLGDIYILYKRIYTDDSVWLDLVKNGLKASRSVYRLFDQQQIKLLGSKSGTVKDNDGYWVGDSGVVEINGQKYFLGAMFRDKNISSAVKRMREVGSFLIDALKDD